MLIAALISVLALSAHADEFTCKVESTTDGDTFRCDDNTRVRIHGIDAPELATPEGPASRNALQALIEARTLACEQNGTKLQSRRGNVLSGWPGHCRTDGSTSDGAGLPEV